MQKMFLRYLLYTAKTIGSPAIPIACQVISAFTVPIFSITSSPLLFSTNSVCAADHRYLPTKSSKGVEENLDLPMLQLALAYVILNARQRRIKFDMAIK